MTVPSPTLVPPPTVPDAFIAAMARRVWECQDTGTPFSITSAEYAWTWLGTHGYIAQPEQADDGWVSVEERLPVDGSYLVVAYGAVDQMAFGSRFWWRSGIPQGPHAVTHWRALPQPPKGGDADDGN